MIAISVGMKPDKTFLSKLSGICDVKRNTLYNMQQQNTIICRKRNVCVSVLRGRGGLRQFPTIN